jgi:hypothetical protein
MTGIITGSIQSITQGIIGIQTTPQLVQNDIKKVIELTSDWRLLMIFNQWLRSLCSIFADTWPSSQLDVGVTELHLSFQSMVYALTARVLGCDSTSANVNRFNACIAKWGPEMEYWSELSTEITTEMDWTKSWKGLEPTNSGSQRPLWTRIRMQPRTRCWTESTCLTKGTRYNHDPRHTSNSIQNLTHVFTAVLIRSQCSDHHLHERSVGLVFLRYLEKDSNHNSLTFRSSQASLPPIRTDQAKKQLRSRAITRLTQIVRMTSSHLCLFHHR